MRRIYKTRIAASVHAACGGKHFFIDVPDTLSSKEKASVKILASGAKTSRGSS